MILSIVKRIIITTVVILAATFLAYSVLGVSPVEIVEAQESGDETLTVYVSGDDFSDSLSDTEIRIVLRDSDGDRTETEYYAWTNGIGEAHFYGIESGDYFVDIPTPGGDGDYVTRTIGTGDWDTEYTSSGIASSEYSPPTPFHTDTEANLLSRNVVDSESIPSVNIYIEDDEIVIGEEAEFRAEVYGASSSDVSFEWRVDRETVGDNSQTHTHEFEEAGEFEVKVVVTPANGGVWPDGTSEPVEGELSLEDDEWMYDDEMETERINFHTLTVSSFDEDENPLEAAVSTTETYTEERGEEVELQVKEREQTVYSEYLEHGEPVLYNSERIDVTEDMEIELTLEEKSSSGVVGGGDNNDGGSLASVSDLLRSPVETGQQLINGTVGIVSSAIWISVLAIAGLAILTFIRGGGWFVWLLSLLGGSEDEFSSVRDNDKRH